MIADADLITNTAPSSRRKRAVQQCELLRPLPIQTLSRDYWRFLSASVFFDFGFGLFFFLFNLYLAAQHFNERSIGLFTSAFTIGSLAATLPAGLLAKRRGLRPLLAFCILGAPVAAAIRVLALSNAAQSFASFLFGVTLCGWAVCTPTALARLTNARNRSIGFSLNFGVGIGSGVLAGFIGGFLPARLVRAFALGSLAAGMRITLLLAAASVLLGAIPLARRSLLAHVPAEPEAVPVPTARRAYLPRFLFAFGVWSAVTAAIAPFANLYMARRLNIPLPQIGEIFAISQFVQVLAVLSTPLLHRRFGMRRTIIAVQCACSVALILLGFTHMTSFDIVGLILLHALLYMAGPGIYALLMSNTPDADRSTASAAQSITASLAGAAAAALAGILVFRFGYPALFLVLAAIALVAALLFAITRSAEADANAL